MAIKWSEIHVGIKNMPNCLFIGRRGIGKLTHREEWVEVSADRTDEIITAVAKRLSNDVKREHNPDKPYAGRVVPGLGRLVFVPDGYDFHVIPSESREPTVKMALSKKL